MNNVIFEVTETSYVEAVWYVAWEHMDWMAMVYRDGPDRPWRATYRFRYYKDNEAWQSEDEKSIYDVKGTDGSDTTREVLAHGFDEVIAAMAQDPGVRTHEKLDIHGDSDRFVELFTSRSWAHVKVAPPTPDGVQ